VSWVAAGLVLLGTGIAAYGTYLLGVRFGEWAGRGFGP
jgi:hypothetical protein